MKTEKIRHPEQETFPSGIVESKPVSSTGAVNSFGLSFKGNIIQADVFESKLNNSRSFFSVINKICAELFSGLG